jgi:hypothetical protein
MRRLTRSQQVAVVVGLAIALSSIAEGPAVSGALRLVGYPAALFVIVRWLPVVKQRLTTMFLLHQAAVAAIVAGWALVPRWSGVAVNGAWGVIAAAWYLRRRRE